VCVCVCVRLSLATFPHYCMDPDTTWRNGRGCPLDVHYWADLQSMHGFHYNDNTHVCKLIAIYTANACRVECKMSASTCTRSIAGSAINVAAGNSTCHRRASRLPASVSLYVRRRRPVTVCYAGSADTVTSAFVWSRAA